MSVTDAKLAALIGSRICHDLISPIGAINNGLELLGMTGSAAGPEMDLIADSVENASARIRFFRVAFGFAGAQEIGPAEAQSIIGDMMKTSRVRMAYLPTEPQPRRSMRLAFLALLCLENALPYGGDVTIECEGGCWRLRGTSEKLNIEPRLWSGLSEPALLRDIEPAQVQFALLPILMREADLSFKTEISATHVEITF